MTLLLRNTQKLIKFNEHMFERHIDVLREIIGLTSFDLAVICCDDNEIQRLNKKYRGLDEPTDVLAFSFLEPEITSPGQIPSIDEPDERILGDIMLAMPYIARDCAKKRERLEEVLPVMVTHGICHLIGYDHEDADQWKQMYHKELDILTKFNAATGMNCRPLLKVGHYFDDNDT